MVPDPADFFLPDPGGPDFERAVIEKSNTDQSSNLGIVDLKHFLSQYFEHEFWQLDLKFKNPFLQNYFGPRIFAAEPGSGHESGSRFLTTYRYFKN